MYWSRLADHIELGDHTGGIRIHFYHMTLHTRDWRIDKSQGLLNNLRCCVQILVCFRKTLIRSMTSSKIRITLLHPNIYVPARMGGSCSSWLSRWVVNQFHQREKLAIKDSNRKPETNRHSWKVREGQQVFAQVSLNYPIQFTSITVEDSK
jgi:hypothetical protein